MRPFAVSNVSLDFPSNPILGIHAVVNSQGVSVFQTTSMKKCQEIQNARKGGQTCIRVREARLNIVPSRKNRGVDGARDARPISNIWSAAQSNGADPARPFLNK